MKLIEIRDKFGDTIYTSRENISFIEKHEREGYYTIFFNNQEVRHISPVIFIDLINLLRKED